MERVLVPDAGTAPHRVTPGMTTAQRAALERTHFWFPGRDDLVRNLLDRFAAGGPVLDLGCGSGLFASQLGHAGTPAIGLDRVLHRHPALVAPGVRGDALRLPFRDGSAAVALLRDVLEHVDEAAALAECRRVLRPGGVLVTLVPAWPSLWSCRDEVAGHRRRYTRASLRIALQGGGFDVLELRGYQFVLLPLVVASRLVAQRRGASQLAREERPPAALSAVLTRINRAEASLARYRWLRPPTGSTIAAVARRR